MTATQITTGFLFEYQTEFGDVQVQVTYDNKVTADTFSVDRGLKTLYLSEDEKLQYIAKKDAILNKFLKARKLFEKLNDLQFEMDKVIKNFKSELNPGDNIDEGLINSVSNLEIDYMPLNRELQKTPCGVLEGFEKREQNKQYEVKYIASKN